MIEGSEASLAGREAETRFRRVVEASPMGVHLYRLDSQGRLVFAGANPAAQRILGLDHGALLGLPIEAAFPPLAATEIPARYREVAATGKAWSTEQIDYQDERVAGAFEVHAFQTTPGEVAALFLDITRRKRAEEALRRSEERYRIVVEGIEDLVVKTDAEGRFLFVSESYCRAFGRTEAELLGRPFMPLVHPDDRAGTARAMEDLFRPPWRCYLEQRALTSGGWRWLGWSDKAVRDAQGRVVAIVATGRDITERRRLAEVLRVSEKMQAVGQLAGGIAHDFNNQLTGILSAADELREELADRPELAELAGMILQAARRSARLTGQLLAFARKGKVRSEPVELHGVVAEVVALLQRSIDKRIAVETRLEAEGSVVLGDQASLHNALLNLALNARDAMPAGGRLSFGSRVEVLDAAACARFPFQMAPGRYLRLEVEDTGVGMDDAVRRRLFEPFFTTKEGKGTGLGLAAVYGTVKSHRGAIEVESAPGQGTRFALHLPLAEVPPLPERFTPPGALMRPRRILLVDDEPQVRNALARTLVALGHEVVQASGGRDGVATFVREGARFDLVFLDLMMPDLSGSEVHAALARLDPEVRVVVTSGYGVEGDAQKVLDAGARAFLPKPFERDDVLRALSLALAEP